jgi:rhodanese-related sulfurtransferase
MAAFRLGCSAVELDDPLCVLVDVRDEDREGYGHIRGSWHHPSDKFSVEALCDQLSSQAPDATSLVFYCAQSRARGPSCASRARSHLSGKRPAIQVGVLSGGFDEWYDQGFERCFCKNEQCRSTVNAQRHPSLSVPPVVLLSDTTLLWRSVREEVFDEAVTALRMHGRAKEHQLLPSLVKTLKQSRPEARSRRLRACFVGALSGENDAVAAVFMELARSQMGDPKTGPADARLAQCFGSHCLQDDARNFLESADIIVVGGCINMPPELAEVNPGYAGAPEGPRAGLEAMHAAGVFGSLSIARSRGACVIGIAEGGIVLGDGPLNLSDSTAGGAHGGWLTNWTGGGTPIRCGALLTGLHVQVASSIESKAGGEASTSRWPSLCRALASEAAGKCGVRRALGIPSDMGAIVFDDGSISAIGSGQISVFERHEAAEGCSLRRSLHIGSAAPFDQDANGVCGLWDGPQRVAAAKLERAVALLRGCKRIVAFTGAGISAESGMPTFRETVAAEQPVSAEGDPLNNSAIETLTPLWSQSNPADFAHIDTFHEDPKAWWKNEVTLLDAFGLTQPNPAHAALARLEAAGLLSGVVRVPNAITSKASSHLLALTSAVLICPIHRSRRTSTAYTRLLAVSRCSSCMAPCMPSSARACATVHSSSLAGCLRTLYESR